MGSWARLAAILLAAMFVSPLLGQEAKKPGEEKKPAEAKKGNPGLDDIFGKDEKKDAKKEESGKDTGEEVKPLRLGQSITGKVKAMGGANGDLTIEVTGRMQVPRPSAATDMARRQQDLQRRQYDLMRAQANLNNTRDPRQRQQRLYEYQRQMAEMQRYMAQPPVQMFDVKEYKQDVIVRLAGDAKIRVQYPEPQYDDKGNLVRFTREVLAKLRGPENLPGFPADLSQVKTGTVVQLYTELPERKAAGQAGAGEKGKKGGPDIADILGAPAPANPEAGSKGQPAGGDALVDPNVPRIVLVMILGPAGQ